MHVVMNGCVLCVPVRVRCGSQTSVVPSYLSKQRQIASFFLFLIIFLLLFFRLPNLESS